MPEGVKVEPVPVPKACFPYEELEPLAHPVFLDGQAAPVYEHGRVKIICTLRFKAAEHFERVPGERYRALVAGLGTVLAVIGYP